MLLCAASKAALIADAPPAALAAEAIIMPVATPVAAAAAPIAAPAPMFPIPAPPPPTIAAQHRRNLVHKHEQNTIGNHHHYTHFLEI